MSLGDSLRHGGEVQEPREGEDTLAKVTVPCENLALAETLSQLPDVTVSSGSVADSGDGVLPLLWMRAPDHDRLETALREDPTTTSVTRLTTRGEERLYRISWAPNVRILVEMLTAEGGTVMDASVSYDEWRMRVLYPSHHALSDAVSCCEQHNVSVEVQSIRQMTGDSSRQYGLTERQYQSLKLACEQGYFEIPRETNLGEVAKSQGISHQALSERLRRGTEKIVSQALFCNRDGGYNRI